MLVVQFDGCRLIGLCSGDADDGAEEEDESGSPATNANTSVIDLVVANLNTFFSSIVHMDPTLTSLLALLQVCA